MQIFFTLLIKISPLYGLIALSYIVGKFFTIDRKIIAKFLIYIVIPLVVFNGVISAKLTAGNIALPITFFVVATLISFFAAWLGRRFWHDSTKNLLAFASGSGNTGYFGIPVAVAIFSNDMFSLAVLSTLGIILFENTFGFYHVSRGHYSVRDSLNKILKLPSIWTFIIGLILNIFGIHFTNSHFTTYSNVVKDIYVFFGMSMIGLSLAAIKTYQFDFKFLIFSHLNKFILWPILIGLIILFDKLALHIFSADNYRILLLMSIVPLAANTVVYATELRAHPEKAATAVFISTVIALFYIPLMVGIFIK
ncbi:MAG: transporter [Patescibacteria group bacterium]|jgi:hypothetical protein